LKVAQDVVLGNDEQAGKSREGRLNTGAEFSAVPSGLLDGAFLTQDYVLGYFQTSLRDSVQSSHADSKALIILEQGVARLKRLRKNAPFQGLL